MGLLNFFRGAAKAKQDDFRNKPEYRFMICHAQGQQVLKQVENLQAVGRHKDADEAAWKYVETALPEWSRAPKAASYLLNMILQVLSMHSQKDVVVEIHESLLQKMEGTLDLTAIYFSLGSVYHQISLNELGGLIYRGGPDSVYAKMPSKKRELWAYHMAAEAKPPPGCESAAWPQLKAWAHFQAREVAYKVGDDEKYEWHRKKLESLVPGTDLNDMEKFMEFVADKQS